MRDASLQVRSYAKVNLTLDVLFRREDGYHEIRTIFQTVSLFDRLEIASTNGAIEISCADPAVPCDQSNLVYRAAEALRGASGSQAGARISIEKRIPVAAGLGGGSSNAAATLLGLCKLWGVELSDAGMNVIARSLGSDVPFFLVGGTALGIGRGEEVYPLEEFISGEIILANPRVAVSTGEAYASLGRLTRSNPVRIIPFSLQAAKGILRDARSAKNDLEEAAIAAHPQIGELKRSLSNLGARYSLMSGSGATVYGVFDNLKASEAALREIREAGYWAERVRTVSRSEYLETMFEHSRPEITSS